MTKNLQPNQQADFLEPPKGAATLHPKPGGLFEDNPVRRNQLRRLEGRSIVSVKDLSREVVIELAKLAAILQNFEIAPYRVLEGKIITTAFFEASTRTRTSFEIAGKRLSADTQSISASTSAVVASGSRAWTWR